MEKYLVRKQIILEDGIKQNNSNPEVIIPFANISISETDIDPTNVVLATKAQMTAEIAASVTNSHKVILGEYNVDDVAEMNSAIADYEAGNTLTLTNGQDLHKGISVAGEVIYFTPHTGATFKSEEYIVGTDKSLIPLTSNNADGTEFADLETRVKTVEDGLTLVDTSVEVDGKIAVEKTERENDVQTLNTAIAANKTTSTQNTAEVVALRATDDSLAGRIQAIEEAELIEDKVWEGSLAGADSVDLSTITDQYGDAFDFTSDKVLEVIIEKTSAALEQGHDLTVGAANATPYVIGQRSFTAKLGTDGHLAMTETGAGDLADFKIIKVLESQAVKAVTNAYTKTESDSKYATKVELTTVDNKFINKQDKTDTTLTTASKAIVGAINEVKGLADQANSLAGQIGGIKTSDGDDLSTTLESVVTEKTLAGYVTTAQMDAAIAAALATVMDVTFDDNTKGIYKLGK